MIENWQNKTSKNIKIKKKLNYNLMTTAVETNKRIYNVYVIYVKKPFLCRMSYA